MSTVKTVNPCPSCGAVPWTATGEYPWYDFDSGDKIECMNAACKRPLFVAGGTQESIVDRWNNPTDIEWEMSDKRAAFLRGLLRILAEELAKYQALHSAEVAK